jgi:hypothetical protein
VQTSSFGLRWGLKKNCSLHREPSNNVSHATYTQRNRVDSQLLVVESQIANLTSGPFFGHNLCFRCPNGQCNPILEIYITRTFQWYKELLEPLSFDPCNHSLNIEDDAFPSPKLDPRWALIYKTMELWGLEGTFPTLSTKRGRRGVLKPRDGTRKRDKL